MLVAGERGPDDRIALRGLAQPLLPNEGVEFIEDGLFHGGILSGRFRHGKERSVNARICGLARAVSLHEITPMKLWKPLAVMISALSLWSCGSPQVLDVRPLHIRDVGVGDSDDPMIRGERKRRFHGAISMGEQGDRLGYTYTVQWNDASTPDAGQIVFKFQQGATGSRVKRMVHPIAAGDTSGRAEFAILGDDYRKGGRVLAWRCSLVRGGREVASRHSYLWQ